MNSVFQTGAISVLKRCLTPQQQHSSSRMISSSLNLLCRNSTKPPPDTPAEGLNTTKQTPGTQDDTITHQTPDSSAAGIGAIRKEDLTAFRKWVLVQSKIYPDTESIPERVTAEKLRIAQDRVRMKTALFLTILSFVAMIVISIRGSITRRNRTGTYLDDYAKEVTGFSKEDE